MLTTKVEASKPAIIELLNNPVLYKHVKYA